MSDLVDPRASSFAARVAAPRLEGTPAEPVALVDSMLNRSAGWGAGILDAVAVALARRWPSVRIERIDRPQLGAHHPDAWAAVMAPRYAALVVAAGD